jgi:hypothetical protein
MLFLNILKNLNQILFFIFNFSIPSVFIDFNKKFANLSNPILLLLL